MNPRSRPKTTTITISCTPSWPVGTGRRRRASVGIARDWPAIARPTWTWPCVGLQEAQLEPGPRPAARNPPDRGQRTAGTATVANDELLRLSPLAQRCRRTSDHTVPASRTMEVRRTGAGPRTYRQKMTMSAADNSSTHRLARCRGLGSGGRRECCQGAGCRDLLGNVAVSHRGLAGLRRCSRPGATPPGRNAQVPGRPQ